MLRYVAPLEQRLRHLGSHVPKRKGLTAVSQDAETPGQRLAEHAAAALGSWRFIGIQGVIMLVWIIWNAAGPILHWDSYPYIALNLAMSAEAAFTGPILLIAANVGAIRDHRQYDRMEQLERRIEDLDERIMTKLEALSTPAPATAPIETPVAITPAPKRRRKSA